MLAELSSKVLLKRFVVLRGVVLVALVSTGEEALTHRAGRETPRALQQGGRMWWFFGALALLVFAFFPVPWVWPPPSYADLLPAARNWPQIATLVALFVAFVLVRRWALPAGSAENIRIAWCFGFIALQALLLRVTIEVRPFVNANSGVSLPDPVLVFPWLLPVGLAAVLFQARHGFMVAVGTAVIAWLMPESKATSFLCSGLVLAGFVGALSLRRCPLRWHLMRGSLRAGATFGLLVMVDVLLRTRRWEEVAAAGAYPVVILSVAGLALLVVLPLFEWLTGSPSDITLIEYASDHRLLDKLRSEAPGTWNHSINVADLSESAARAIGANALFCRTASLFHDIGKTAEPEIFAENQRGESPHDQLSPRESAEKIVAHVPNGLNLAARYRLPHPFRRIIAEHHGTSLVRFFYARAVEKIEDPEEKEGLRAAFRYPGPPPSSRESGIIALADAVEAAARSMQNPDDEAIRNLVQGLVVDRIKEDEFRRCALTLEELSIVEATFITLMTSRHHKRPAYPKVGGGAAAPSGPAGLEDGEAGPGAEAQARTPAVKKIRPKTSRTRPE